MVLRRGVVLLGVDVVLLRGNVVLVGGNVITVVAAFGVVGGVRLGGSVGPVVVWRAKT